MMADPRPLLALILIIFLVFTPDVQVDGPAARAGGFRELADQTRAHLNVSSTSSYGDFRPDADRWLSLPGLTNGTGFGWWFLDDFRRRTERMSLQALGTAARDKLMSIPVGAALPFYNNITGILHGSWTRDDGSFVGRRPVFNVTEYAGSNSFGPNQITGFGRNLSAPAGTMSVRLHEYDYHSVGHEPAASSCRYITATLSLQPRDHHESASDFHLHGVHFLETGHVLLSTTSRKFAGIHALPHFSHGNYQFRVALGVLTSTINKTIVAQQQGEYGLGVPFSSGLDGQLETSLSLPRCELVVWLQQQRVVPLASAPGSSDVNQQVDFINKAQEELRHPTGLSLPALRDMHFSLAAFSPDCGYALNSNGPPEYVETEADHLSGKLGLQENRRARHHTSLFIVVLFGQLWSLYRQMKDSSTPSTRSRISIWTVGAMAIGDAFTTISFVIISIVMDGVWGLLITAGAFVAFVSSAFLGMQLLMDIWTVRNTEHERRARERRAATPATIHDPPVSQSARESAVVPIMMGSDQEDALDVGTGPGLLPTAVSPTNVPVAPRSNTYEALVARFYLCVMILIFISIWASSWPQTYRRAYFAILSFIYLSLWIPQIYQNAIRNCCRPLMWEFVMIQSILRFSPFGYFYGYQNNIIYAEVQLSKALILLGWMWLQCFVLASQDVLGPRWFFKAAWVPAAYDYHQMLRQDEEGSNLPAGVEASSAASTDIEDPTRQDEKEPALHKFDCAICMQDLEVAVQRPDTAVDVGLAGPLGVLARRSYMLTPCRHIFHTKCLEGWMKYRLQCPICREDLPPI